MKTQKHYRLYGFMEYVPTETGFVTPVFCDGPDFYVQVISKDSKIAYFEEFFDPDNRVFKLPDSDDEQESRSDGDECLFAFKQYNVFRHHDGTELCQKLMELIDDYKENYYLYESIQSFIETYAAGAAGRHDLFPDKIKIWEDCLLGLEAKFGTAMCEAYRKTVMPESFQEHVLSLYFPNETLQEIFTQTIKHHLEAIGKTNYGPAFKIKVSFSYNKAYPRLKWGTGIKGIYYKEHFWPLKGSFKRGTSIKPYYRFDNFESTGSNSEALAECLRFAVDGSSRQRNILIIGAGGSGKSHLMNALFNYLDAHVDIAVSAFRASGSFVQFKNARLKNSYEFEALASDSHVIFFDNSHLLNEKRSPSSAYWDVLKKFNEQGKSLVLTCSAESYSKGQVTDILHGMFTEAIIGPLSLKEKLRILERKVKLSALPVKERVLFTWYAYASSNLLSVFSKITRYYLGQKTVNKQKILDEKHHSRNNHVNRLACEQHGLTALRSIVSKHMNYEECRLCYASTTEYDRMISDLVLFVFELFGNCSSASDINPLLKCYYASENYTFGYWEDQFFNNSEFRNILKAIYKDMKHACG